MVATRGRIYPDHDPRYGSRSRSRSPFPRVFMADDGRPQPAVLNVVLDDRRFLISDDPVQDHALERRLS